MSDLRSRQDFVQKHEEFLPTLKDKVIFYTGLICVIVAIVFIMLPEVHEFPLPLWIASAILATIALLSAGYHHFLPPSMQKYDIGMHTQSCADLLRDKAVITFIIFGILALTLKLNIKYHNFSMSMCPEVVLSLVAIACWQISKF